MSVTSNHAENAELFKVRIRVVELGSEAQVRRVIDGYNAALDEIDRRMAAGERRFVGIALSVKRGLIKMQRAGLALRAARTIANSGSYRPVRNPWNAICPEFWLVAWQFPTLHDRIAAVIDKIERMLAAARQRDGGPFAYWEDETTGFGEPLVTVLALQDVRFVDGYRRLMNEWDMLHEFEHLEVIELIVRNHGLRAATEQLLYDRATISTGQNGEAQIEALVPMLDQAYGRFVESPLFERIIAWWHAADMKDREEAHDDWQRWLAVNPEARPRPRNDPPFHHSDNAELKAAAATMFAERDRVHPLAAFLTREREISPA